jgi:hypothetical protein
MSRAARCGASGLRVFGKPRTAIMSQRRAHAARGRRRHHQFEPILALGGQVAHELIDEIDRNSTASDFDHRLSSYPGSIISCRRQPAKTNSQILVSSSPRVLRNGTCHSRWRADPPVGQTEDLRGGQRAALELRCGDSVAATRAGALRRLEGFVPPERPAVSTAAIATALRRTAGPCRLQSCFHPHRNSKVPPKSRRNGEMLLSAFPRIQR